MNAWTSVLVAWFLGPTQVLNTINGILIGSAIFAQLMADSPIHYNGPTLSPKIDLCMGNLDPI